jgi:hypothetical protein
MPKLVAPLLDLVFPIQDAVHGSNGNIPDFLIWKRVARTALVIAKLVKVLDIVELLEYGYVGNLYSDGPLL